MINHVALQKWMREYKVISWTSALSITELRLKAKSPDQLERILNTLQASYLRIQQLEDRIKFLEDYKHLENRISDLELNAKE